MMLVLLAALCWLSLTTPAAGQCSDGGTCNLCSCPPGYGGALCQDLLPWLYTSCSTYSDCSTVSNTMCYLGQCLCSHGFFYSVGTKQCVPTCARSDLQNTYTLYMNGGIDGHNAKVLKPATEQECMAACNSDASCLNFEFYTVGQTYCNIHYVTLLDLPANWGAEENWKFFIRNCA